MSKTTHARRQQSAATTLFTRRAPVRASSYDPADGTFEAVIATGTPVLRRDFEGEYYEVLSLNPKAVRLSRMQSGAAPVLDTHRSGSASDQVGIVTDARIQSGQLITSARLSRRDDVKPIADDLAGGTPPNVSVGYRVYATEETMRADGARVLTRTDWEPYEMSFVAVPADPTTHVRSNKEITMPKTVTAGVNDQDESVITESRSASPKMSATESLEAYTIAANANLGADFVRQHIDAGETLSDFRTLVLNKKADGVAPINGRTREGNDGSLSDPEFLARSVQGALYSRMTGKAPEGAAREIMGRSMLDMGAMLLEARGERVSWRNRDQLADQVFSRTMATSDLPNLLTASGNRVLQDAYQVAESPLKDLARRRIAPDYRTLTTVKLSQYPSLLPVTEGGEIKYGSVSEAKEAYGIKNYARIFSITREALVNDDLNAFAESNAMWGRAGAETEAQLLVSMFTANSANGLNMADGNPLYTTGHTNKAASGGAINVATLNDARLAMRQTTGLDGKTLIGVSPKHLVVGAVKETEAQQFLATTLFPSTPSAINPFAGSVVLHVEPRFTGNAWRMFADPAQLAVIEIAYLAGHDGMQLTQKEGWETLGWEFRAVLTFGCGLRDWRGTYLNPGN
jgi:phage major head subunit gpT-like protein